MIDNEKRIWSYLISRINNPFGVAGLMGILYAESKFRPNNLQGGAETRLGMTDEEYTNAVDTNAYSMDEFINDSAGYGLAQWTHPSRKKAMYQYIKSRGYSIGDFNAQLDFIWEELQKYKTVLQALKDASSTGDASDIVMQKYEQPANQGEAAREKRARFSNEIFARIAGEQYGGDETMSNVNSTALVTDFQQMYNDKWGYIPSASGQTWTQEDQNKKAQTDSGVAKYGQQWVGHKVADCSGAFVCAYKKYNLPIYHGSNRIARKYVVELLPPSMAEPGMAAFKARKPGEQFYALPADYKYGGSYYNGDLNDYYHIGLVDTDTDYVLNSASTSSGFKRSKLADGWCAVARLKNIIYEGGVNPVEHLYYATVVADSGNTVNLRKSPSASAVRICAVPVGSIVEVLTEHSNEWVEIRYGEKTGYMMCKFLQKNEETFVNNQSLIDALNQIIAIAQRAVAIM